MEPLVPVEVMEPLVPGLVVPLVPGLVVPLVPGLVVPGVVESDVLQLFPKVGHATFPK